MLKPQPERKLENREAENQSVGGLSPKPSHHSKIGLDPTAAMELHKSKSYIVSLIDRALSKELGTVPEAKFARPQVLLLLIKLIKTSTIFIRRIFAFTSCIRLCVAQY